MTDPFGVPRNAFQPATSFASLLRSVGAGPSWDIPAGAHIAATEATTVLALRYGGGVVMVGDRQATEGYSVAHRRIEKVFPADSYSAVAISGTAGVAIEMVKLLQTELEHYEKIEGTRLSLDGKANLLATMVRNQLPAAMQGLVVIPIFCGYHEQAAEGRLYSYDVVGGRYEEIDFVATGSGGREARSHLRAFYRDDFDRTEAVAAGLGALIAAAEEDTATAGPDVRRGIYPTVVVIDAAGFTEVGEEEVAQVSRQALEQAR
ncbi:MAG: proteasome subunit beta [Dehalococcoidia bacterium]